VNLGEIVVVWKGGGGHVLVEDFDNEACGGVACWLEWNEAINCGRRALGMIHTGMRFHPG
jgi:hypothetical protein